MRSSAMLFTAQHSTAQHSTAQHSTAQHSTAQHSTAQDNSVFFKGYVKNNATMGEGHSTNARMLPLFVAFFCAKIFHLRKISTDARIKKFAPCGLQMKNEEGKRK